MSVDKIKEIVKKEFGVVINVNYYSLIDRWRQWTKGEVKEFHTYLEKMDDGSTTERRIRSLKMAKKVCEDWASLLLNERSKIMAMDGNANTFLNGEDNKGGLLQEIDFPRNTNMLIEKAFYSGTGAIVVRVKGMPISLTGKIKPSQYTKIDLVYLEANYIYPLKVQNEKIVDVVFASTSKDGEDTIIYLERHHEEKGKQVIENIFYRSKNGCDFKRTSNPKGIPKRIETECETPFFAIIKPNVNNMHDNNMGLGCAIFDQAEDILEGMDVAYDNLTKEFILGKKKVIYNKSLLKTMMGKDGKMINVAPDQTLQQLFFTLPDEGGDAPYIKEFNPVLRVGDTTEGIQAFLNYLSFKCGMGSKHYHLKDDGRVVTAKEYSGERQELRQHANKHSQIIVSAITTIMKTLLWVGKNYKQVELDVNSDIVVDLKDGYLISDEELREQDLRDVQNQIMNPWEYRMKWFGEDKETAKANAPQMQVLGDVFDGA